MTDKLLRALAEPWPSGSKVKCAIDRAARAAGLSYWRAFDIWYRKARRIEPHEIGQIKNALAQQQRQAAKNELHQLKVRLALLEARINQISDLDGAEIDPAWRKVC